MSLSPELTALRDEAMRTSCQSWSIQKRWKLSRGIELVGPCPKCGGTDRFGIHSKKNVFNCRVCGIAGSGVIDLVMQTEGVEFIAACEIITGRKASDPIDEKRAAQIREQNARDEKKREAAAAAYREQARRAAFLVWQSAGKAMTAPLGVRHYLMNRAIDLDLVPRPDWLNLREIAAHPWREAVDGRRDEWVTIHTGPAMIACVQQRDGHFGAVHVTWIDAYGPKGRLVLPERAKADGATEARPTKKVLGVKKGGAIRLYTPEGATRIVMGEGIESTLTPLCHAFEERTAYWAGVDLGNMSGRPQRDDDGHILYDTPDLDDMDCFLPPDWCEELVYLGEGDAPRVHSKQKCLCGLKRAKILRERARLERPELPPLNVRYVPPPGVGKDLNDIAMEELANEGMPSEASADAGVVAT